MEANAILDMYSAIETAREAYDKADLERVEAEAKRHAGKAGRR